MYSDELSLESWVKCPICTNLILYSKKYYCNCSLASAFDNSNKSLKINGIDVSYRVTMGPDKLKIKDKHKLYLRILREKGLQINSSIRYRNDHKTSKKPKKKIILSRNANSFFNKPIKKNNPCVITKEMADKFYKTWEWKKIRFEVLKKYDPKCMLCGSNDRIVVDHIKPLRYYYELRLQFHNLQVLCRDCNMGKSNNDETSFLPK